MIKVLQNLPGGFLNFVAGKNHIYPCIDAALYLNGKDTGVAVQILGFAFKSIKAVCILQVKLCDASHSKFSFVCIYGYHAPVCAQIKGWNRHPPNQDAFPPALGGRLGRCL